MSNCACGRLSDGARGDECGGGAGGADQDSEPFIVDDQLNATCGLDRIDQRDLPRNNIYSYSTLATGVHVYVVDTGVRSVRLTVTDTAGQFGVASQSVTVIAGGAPCTGCQEYTGTLSGTGDSDIHPGGTYYFSSQSGAHRGWLRGPSNADFDLYLQKWNGFSWGTVARSESATSEEQIAYSGTIGYYRWRVVSFSGSGSYTFWLQRP